MTNTNPHSELAKAATEAKFARRLATEDQRNGYEVGYFDALQSLQVENERLREELQIAVDDHDSHFGRANFVGHWTNTARTLLGDS